MIVDLIDCQISEIKYMTFPRPLHPGLVKNPQTLSGEKGGKECLATSIYTEPSCTCIYIPSDLIDSLISFVFGPDSFVFHPDVSTSFVHLHVHVHVYKCSLLGVPSRYPKIPKISRYSSRVRFEFEYMSWSIHSSIHKSSTPP